METINKICFIIVFGVICFAVGYYIGNNNNEKTNYDNVIIPDTTYNKVTLDSIEYNINKKESTIIELKKRTKYEIEQAINANDDIAIKQFKELAGAD